MEHGIDDWQPLDRLAHLQLDRAPQPYLGPHLRSFNEHAWWYRLEFPTPAGTRRGAALRFEGVDYFARVWLNERLLGDHEGYFEPFQFEVGALLRPAGANLLVVKVWSRWDVDVLPGREQRRFSLSANRYRRPLHHPAQPPGHPHRMDHALGMRLYWA